MNTEDYRKKNEVTYTEYKNIKDNYAHVGSFALWPEKFQEVKYIAEDLQAIDEEEFNRKLKGKLQKGAVLLGLNFGVRKGDKLYDEILNSTDKSIEERLHLRRQVNNLSNQHGKMGTFRSVHNSLDEYKGNESIFSGAYMTDLFKFSLDEKGKWAAGGIATPDQRGLNKIIAEHPELVDVNIEGLKYELQDVLHVPNQFVLVLMGGATQKYKKLLKEAFPQALVVDYGHYAAFQFSYADWKVKGNTLNEQVMKKIAKW